MNRIVATFFAGWMFLAGYPAWGQNPPDNLIVSSVTVDGKNISVTRNRSLNLGARPQNISFFFGSTTNLHLSNQCVRYKLDGYDADWHNGGFMCLIATFSDEARDQISREEFRVTNQSAGWAGSLRDSTLTHRRETLVAPPHASRLVVVFSSAGPRTLIGVYAVANVTISKVQSNGVPVTLLKFPPESDWIHDGNVPSMAKVMTVGHSPPQEALVVLDNNPEGGAGWRNPWSSAQIVNPGDQIILEWDEMYSMGVPDLNSGQYRNLPEGHYLFRVGEFDLFGRPTGNESVLDVIVPPPFWRQPWFWPLGAVIAIILALGNWRYLVWRKVRVEMVRLRTQQALEKERLRIARDIHDDLGARITEISLASALAKNTVSLEAARDDFDRITDMSRELVSALYETVWAVNPEHDNLESLGTYLCQIANNLCKPARISCRFEIDELPADVQVASQIRHNFAMAVKEATHNAVKHARPSEVILRITFNRPELTICLKDNGVGFKVDAEAKTSGNGLNNIKNRLASIGATCQVESQPGQGTSILMQLQL
ncbi:MAG TPA: sensor histidine kinase [Candidatus Sulfotelmatobacter sp.]|jgi:signal transduction histidine kinase|nr:sensor histidine kinase [Candidatus Sulfotelmatobacter sp.]